MPFEYEVDVALAVGDVTIDGDDVALLSTVAETGSLRQATRELGRSYAHALRRIEAIEAEVGTLTERRRGGATGGGTRLTDRGHELLAEFAGLAGAVSGDPGRGVNRLTGTVSHRLGALVVVETPPGPVRALAPGASGRITLAIPAHAITLHPPAGAPTGAPSSARNRLAGRVERVDLTDDVATVGLGCRDAALRATITRESLDRLGLETGDAVVAAFKATATRPLSVGTG